MAIIPLHKVIKSNEISLIIKLIEILSFFNGPVVLNSTSTRCTSTSIK